MRIQDSNSTKPGAGQSLHQTQGDSVVTIGPYIAAAGAASNIQHWTIGLSSVGKVRLGETEAQLRRAGFTFSQCGGKTGGQPCYFDGQIGHDLQFDVDANSRVREIMVNARSGYGYWFATKQGVQVKDTVSKLMVKVHPKYVGDYGYGDAYEIHSGAHQWITFFCDGTTLTSKIYSIAVSTFPTPPQGR